MKTKKTSAAKRARSTVSRRKAVGRRPIHKRVLLHPFTVFMLLCVGVLVAGSTFRGQAVSYDVTATVPAPILTEAAIITDPVANQHVTTDQIVVVGTCPPLSYVKLYRNDLFGGVATCTGGQFSIQTSLLAGANNLQARVLNLTDSEGPSSSAITVYYDVPVVVEPPAAIPVSTAVPTALQVANLDTAGYESGIVEEVGANPTVSGYAPPFSDVTVTFYSEPSVCKTKADAKGVWRCTLAKSLPPGIHHVVVVATTTTGKKLTFPTFQVAVIKYAEPFVLTSDYKYKARQQGQEVAWTIGVSGGTEPFDLVVDWGDGSNSHLVRPDRSTFDITHTYQNRTFTDTDYDIIINATDARGATTVLQLSTVIQGIAEPAVGNRSGFEAVSNMVRQWLWVVWPVYVAVVLMALSFWIGERDAYQRFIARRRANKLQVRKVHKVKS